MVALQLGLLTITGGWVKDGDRRLRIKGGLRVIVCQLDDHGAAGSPDGSEPRGCDF